VGVFERLLGLGSLEYPEAPLIHRHVIFPISSGGIGLIYIEVIALATYLGSWALTTLVITFRFLLVYCSFLLEAIGVNGSGPFPL
jgi:hypothetical protein